MAGDRNRHEPLPGPLGLPAHLLRRLSPRRRALVLGIGGPILVAAIVGAALAVPGLRSEQRVQADAETRRAQAVRAARRARLAREARPRTGTGPATRGRSGTAARAARRALVAGLEADVLADARLRARRGELEKRYRSAACFEFPRRLSTRQPAERLARAGATLECIAVTSRIGPNERTTGFLLGQPFRARIDFVDGRYAWCKIVQVPGELALQRDPVLSVPAACGGTGAKG